MGFQKGKPKTGGRKPGTPNKASPARIIPLIERAKEKGVDPFDVLLDLCGDPDKGIKLAAAREACKYCYAQKKHVEVTPLSEEQSRNAETVLQEFRKVVNDPNNGREERSDQAQTKKQNKG